MATDGQDHYDIFLAHRNCPDDNKFIKSLNQWLKTKSYKTYYDLDDLQGGSELLPSLIKAMRNSSKTLLLVTRESIKSPWCTLEMVVALEKSQRSNIMSVVLLLKDIEEDELPNSGLLHIAPKVRVTASDSEWKNELLQHIEDKVKFSGYVSVGNAAHGLAWSHFCGLLNYALPELDEMIEKSTWFDRNNFPVKLYELIPKTCACSHLRGENTNLARVKYVGKTPVITCARAGSTRNISLPVYEVKDREGQAFYCAAEHPPSIETIKHLAERTKEDNKWLEIGRFYFTINMIITSMTDCKNRAKVLLYDEEGEEVADVLIRAIKEDLHTGTPKIQNQLNLLLNDSTNFEYDVFVCSSEKDRNVKHEIIRFLTQNDLTVYQGKYGTLNLNDENVLKCRWFVIILTKAALDDDNFMSFQQTCLVTEAVDNKKVRVVPVVADEVRDYKIPECLSWIAYIQKTSGSDSYLHHLCRVLKGGEIPLDSKTFLPVGNVAIGLALGYAANFLNLILSDFVARLKSVMRAKQVSRTQCPLKFYVIIPKSCCCPSSFTGERVTLFEKSVEFYRNEVGRKYQCDMHKVTSRAGQDYYFVGLYAAAVGTLHQMSEKNIGGLDSEQLLEQGRTFYDILSNYMGQMSDYCRLIYYDDLDESKPLADVLIDCIQQDTKTTDSDPGAIKLSHVIGPALIAIFGSFIIFRMLRH